MNSAVFIDNHKFFELKVDVSYFILTLVHIPKFNASITAFEIMSVTFELLKLIVSKSILLAFKLDTTFGITLLKTLFVHSRL